MKGVQEINTLLGSLHNSRGIRGTASGMLSATTETAIGSNKFEAVSWNLLLLMAGIGSLCYVFGSVIKTRHITKSHKRV